MLPYLLNFSLVFKTSKLLINYIKTPKSLGYDAYKAFLLTRAFWDRDLIIRGARG